MIQRAQWRDRLAAEARPNWFSARWGLHVLRLRVRRKT
jgi:hypothetical protein